MINELLFVLISDFAFIALVDIGNVECKNVTIEKATRFTLVRTDSALVELFVVFAQEPKGSHIHTFI